MWQFYPISQSNSAPCKHDAGVKMRETVNLSMNDDVTKLSLLSYRHLPWWACKRAIRAFYYHCVFEVSTWLAEEQSPCHINMNINLLTISICKPMINKFLPIRNKLTQLCQWADKKEHNLKAMEEPTVKNERNMIFLN